MNLTTEQRGKLEWLAGTLDEGPAREAIRAALADLDACRDAVEPREVLLKARLKALQDTRADRDACREALRPVARALREPYQVASGKDLRTACLTLAEADAVLAAAGEETP